MVLEQTLYPSWSSIFDSFYEFHWIYKAKEWQFKTFLAKYEKFCLDAFTVSLYNRAIITYEYGSVTGQKVLDSNPGLSIFFTQTWTDDEGA